MCYKKKYKINCIIKKHKNQNILSEEIQNQQCYQKTQKSKYVVRRNTKSTVLSKCVIRKNTKSTHIIQHNPMHCQKTYILKYII